ncbi:SDR family oxidoreductase [Catellatospora tritici]|uniref:SDR family oxidoreductase n=1 Tax=Catellatospora tritici TaxID=2851566 RepID=UPI001C2CF336|nr:SDR family oxidoreductase [Catellatospora tritici]MBV1849564.1 SDR family oxidoreductase [Catellatospora tritici]
MDLGLRDRVAIVTAASKGLGRACALALAAEGARVLVNARSEGALDTLTASMADACAVPGDITDPAVPQRLVDTALARWGRLDIVVGNAAGPPLGGALEVDDDQIMAAMNANMLASIRLARAAVPHMRRQRWGRICFIASATVRQPARDLALSNVARAALWSWTKTAAQDLADDGITVNLACPGKHATERLIARGGAASGRIADPDDFGQVVAFLCSRQAGFVNGVAMGVDGGTVVGLH